MYPHLLSEYLTGYPDFFPLQLDGMSMMPVLREPARVRPPLAVFDEHLFGGPIHLRSTLDGTATMPEQSQREPSWRPHF
jgi:hypothetical protein